MKMLVMIVLGIGVFVSAAEAKVVRATEMNDLLWEKLTKGSQEEIVVEFQNGDELPVTFSASGDLLETSRQGVSYVKVKRNFWIRMKSGEVRISLDGQSYKAIPEVLGGELNVGAGSADNGGIADAINIGLKAVVR